MDVDQSEPLKPSRLFGEERMNSPRKKEIEAMKRGGLDRQGLCLSTEGACRRST